MSRKMFLVGFLSVFFLLALAACGGATIKTIKDVPVYPQSKQLDVDYFMSHAIQGPPWTVIDNTVQGGPYTGFEVVGQGWYSLEGKDFNPSIESFYDGKFNGWTKQKEVAKNEVTGNELTTLSWAKDKQAVVVTYLYDGTQTILTPWLLEKK